MGTSPRRNKHNGSAMTALTTESLYKTALDTKINGKESTSKISRPKSPGRSKSPRQQIFVAPDGTIITPQNDQYLSEAGSPKKGGMPYYYG
jgi:hypothetical protein